MLKRIVSIILVMSMLLAMGVTASAYTTTTTVPFDIAVWDGTVKPTATTTSNDALKSGSLFPTSVGSDINASRSQISILSGGTGTGVQSVTRNSSTGDVCYTFTNNKDLRWRPGTKFVLSDLITANTKPVFSIKYDVMIPDGAGVDGARYFTPKFTSDNEGSTSPSSFKIKYANKSFEVDSTYATTGIDSDSIIYGSADYKPGTWVTIEVRAYYDATTKKLTYGAYVDNTQIFYAEGNIEYTTLYLYEALWSQPSLTTNFDNITYRLLDEADKPVEMEEEVPELPSSVALVTFDGVNPGSTAITSGNFTPATGSISTRTIALSSAGSGSVQSLQDANSDWYIANTHSLIKYMPQTNYDLVAQANANFLPVITFSYDFMIPTGTNANAERTIQLNMGSASGEYGLKVMFENSEVYVDESSLVGMDTTTAVSNKATYTAGEWSKLDIRAYYDATTSKLTYGVYVGDTQIFYGAGNVAITKLHIYDVSWKQGNGVTTNMDDIIVGLLQAADKPVVIDKIIEIPDPIDIFNWNFNSMTTAASSTLAVKSVGEITKNFVNSSSTSKVSTYMGENKADNDMALVVSTTKENIEGKTTGATVMVSTVKSSLNSYVANDGTESVFTGSYDIYIPTDSKDTVRQHVFSFEANDSGTASSTHDFLFTSYIDNGYLYFDTGFETTDAIQLDFKERSEKVAFDCDDWETVNYVVKTTFDTDRYIVKLYGIYKDKCYYENTIEVMGSYFCINNNSLYVYGLEDKDITTKYDNIKLTSVPGYSEELVYGWASANYIHPLMISATVSEVEAKTKVEGNYANLCMVTAVYNTNGNLLKLWTDNELDSDGFLSCKITDSSYLVQGYKVKAFVFDSLTSAIPQVENAELAIQ